MGKLLVLIILFIGMCFLVALPLYLIINLALWLLGVSYYVTFMQTLGIGLIIATLKAIFKKGE